MKYTIIEEWDVYEGPMYWKVCKRVLGIWWWTIKKFETLEEAETLLKNLQLIDSK